MKRERVLTLEDGDRVTAFGDYSGTSQATGKAMRAAFAHMFEVKNGKIAGMVRYVYTIAVSRALITATDQS